MAGMSGDTQSVTFSDTTLDHVTTEWGRNSENTPVFAVVSTVADLSDSDPLELPPLSNVIDPDALNTLFTSRPDADVGVVQFEYAGYNIIVRGSGEVEAEPIDHD